MKFRFATKDDKAALADFLALVFGEEFRNEAARYITESLRDDQFQTLFFLIMEDDAQKIRGCLSISQEIFTLDVWGIAWVAIHPDLQGKGWGQKLMSDALQKIQRRLKQKSTIILATYPEKTSLYEKMGFAKAGIHHEDGYFMTKILMPLDGPKGKSGNKSGN